MNDAEARFFAALDEALGFAPDEYRDDVTRLEAVARLRRERDYLGRRLGEVQDELAPLRAARVALLEERSGLSDG
jgi:hypothetical protein